MKQPAIVPRKLIEIALPLDAINAAAAREKSIRHGHPSTLHLWWARRPLAAARAVIFSQLVNDPEDLWRCQNPGLEPNQQVKGHWTKARARLFRIIEELVKWENTNNETVLAKARDEIVKSWRETCELNRDHPDAPTLFDPERMPGLHDPFAGGGAIPLEALRLGVTTSASDLNPVAVLINKAMIEVPPTCAGTRPVNPLFKDERPLVARHFKGADGLAEDVRYYGEWIYDEAFERIGHLYPPVEITQAMVAERPDLARNEGEKLTVIAWLWARTVKSPNPAFSHVDVPLASTFILSSKNDKQAYVEPVIDNDGYHFRVKVGIPPTASKHGTSFGKQKGFRCLMSQSPMSFEYLRAEGTAGRMGMRLMAIVAESKNGRVFLSPIGQHEETARRAEPCWRPETPVPEKALSIRVQLYGMKTHGALYTSRQLVALTTFGDLVPEVRKKIYSDAVMAGLPDNGQPMRACGLSARAYSDAVSLYLGLTVSRIANTVNTLAVWSQSRDQSVNLFSRQAIPMTWDFPEVNPFAGAAGDFRATVRSMAKTIPSNLPGRGFATQLAAQEQALAKLKIVSTDPPYYDNVGYADLSDFFYVWLRRSLQDVFPEILATIAVPKGEELVATPYRHGSKENAERFFLDGMTRVMENLAQQSHVAYPITIYYAFKQSETATEGTNSAGWETFLGAVMRAGLAVTGTWPMRTERPSGVKTGTNSLASSVVLVCRPRRSDAGTISRRQFIRELNAALPLALDAMTRESEGLHSPVAPVDLSQAIIGPGMAVFSKYSAVLEADGSPMSVKTALQLINRFLAEDDFDPDTQFCLRWFEQHHWDAGQFGEADVLARAKGTSVEGVKQSGVVFASGGQVRLVRPADYPDDWNPADDSRLPIWEALHQLIRAFRKSGESGAGAILAAVLAKAEAARQLAYRLYTLCERAGLAEDARAYNELITSWTAIESAAARQPAAQQGILFE